MRIIYVGTSCIITSGCDSPSALARSFSGHVLATGDRSVRQIRFRQLLFLFRNHWQVELGNHCTLSAKYFACVLHSSRMCPMERRNQEHTRYSVFSKSEICTARWTLKPWKSSVARNFFFIYHQQSRSGLYWKTARNTLSNICRLLEGKVRFLGSDVQHERRRCSKNQEYQSCTSRGRRFRGIVSKKMKSRQAFSAAVTSHYRIRVHFLSYLSCWADDDDVTRIYRSCGREYLYSSDSTRFIQRVFW